MRNVYEEKLNKIWVSADFPDAVIPARKYKLDDPVISVVIPVHNAELYLRSCIDSILSQKLSVPIEIIAVNDNSNDRSNVILEQYKHKHNIWVYQAEQQGASGARNTGIRHARGKYLIFVDADDRIVYDNYFQDLFDRITETEADLVQSGYIKTDGLVTLSTFTPKYEEVKGYARMRETIPGFSWGKIMKAELFEGICFPADYWFEDSIFHMVILKRCGKAAFIKETGYAYYKNLQGITYSKDRTKRSIEAVTVIGKILEMMRAAGMEFDEETTETVLEHIGVVLANRIRKLSLFEQRTAFLYMSEIIKELPPLEENLMYRIYKNRRFVLWKLTCLERKLFRGK